MPYEIIYQKEKGYIAVTVTGNFVLSALMDLAVDVAKRVAQYDCHRILNDMRQAKLTRDTLDIYSMPSGAREAGIVQHDKRALLVSEHSSDFHFLETVFINQGHQVKLFTQADEAVRWLLDEE